MTPCNSVVTPSGRTVQTWFSGVAQWYDFYNRLFSGGIDLWWRRQLVQAVVRQRPKRALDLATGSGDILLGLKKKDVRGVGIDFCMPMLEKAKKRGLEELILADALTLPFAEESFEAVTIAFGLRNFEDSTKGIQEAHRVLKPGGWFYILEFSKPYKWVAPFYFAYLKYILPMVTGFFVDQQAAYTHLYTSIRAFPSAEELKQILKEQGFSEVSYKRMTLGVVALHQAQKK